MTDSASRRALEAPRPLHLDPETAVRPETCPSPGCRPKPSSPHPQTGALNLAGELGSRIDPRARGLNDPLPDPRAGSSSSHPPHGALGLAGEQEHQAKVRDAMEDFAPLFSTPSSSGTWTKVTGSRKGKGKTSGRLPDGSCCPQATSSPHREVGPRVSELEPPPSSVKMASYGPSTPADRPGPQPSTSAGGPDVIILSPEASDPRPIK